MTLEPLFTKLCTSFLCRQIYISDEMRAEKKSVRAGNFSASDDLEWAEIGPCWGGMRSRLGIKYPDIFNKELFDNMH
jgi:hypothetical protein